MCGLFIEMIGVWAILTGRGDKDSTQISLPGGSTVPIAWLVVALGFGLWLTGRVLVSLSRPPRQTPDRVDDTFAWPGRIDDDVAKHEQSDDETGS